MDGRTKRKEEIASLCDHYGCDEKRGKRHFDLYVNKGWNPHPPKRFVKWWTTQPDYASGVTATSAFNCQCYRDTYSEAKAHGVVEVAEF